MKPLFWIVLLLTISTFSQTPGNGVTDIDGNRYNSVIIGTQEWMKENLNVSKYTDGTLIHQSTSGDWGSLLSDGWCNYNDDITLGTVYGKLYNWYAVAGIYDASSRANATLRKQLAPIGWHVPSDAEIAILSNYLGGLTISGTKMKEFGSAHWAIPNNGTNESGLTCLPGGFRSYYANEFSNISLNGFFWSIQNQEVFAGYSHSYYLSNIRDYLVSESDLDRRFGCSVRCIKNGTLNNQSYNNNSLNIFPNPAKDQITIDCGTNSNVIGGNYKIVNTLGQEILNGVLSSQQNIIELINIKGQGVYFVKIYDSSNALLDTKKIIIQQ